MKQLPLRAAFLLLLLTLDVPFSVARAQGTAFTYQGKLSSSGNAANGAYDLQFTLFGTNSGGSAMAGPITNSAVGVTNGLFTTVVDFGNAFNGSSNWLELAVRTNGAASFSPPLAPRQQVTPAPYAILAGNVSGTIASAGLTGTYGNALNLSNANNSFNGSFAGNGANVTGVNAASLNGLGAANFWQTTGNSGTTPGVNFLGTVDNQPLEFWVNNGRGLRLQPGDLQSVFGSAPPGLQGAVSVVGGFNQNSISSGVQGAIIAGGGDVVYLNFGSEVMTNFTPNTISGSSGSADGATISGGMGNSVNNGRDATVSGGQNNTASSQYTVVAGGNNNTASGDTATVGGGQNDVASGRRAVVPGGDSNIAAGRESLAAGRGAQANFDGDFVWADSAGQQISVVNFSSTGIDQFLIRAGGGVGINTNNPHGAALAVNGDGFFTGKVGIGTAGSPAFSLVIADSIDAPAGMLLTGTNTVTTAMVIENTSSGGHRYDLVTSGSDGTSVGSFGLFDQTAAAYRMLVDSTGKVGIGTTTPSTALQVNGTVTATSFSGAGTSLTGVALTGSANTFTTDQTVNGQITAGGSVGAMTLLDRFHPVNGFGWQWRADSTGLNASRFNGGGGSQYFTISTNGQFGIGTTAPVKSLEVSGAASGVASGGSVESSIIMRLDNTSSDGSVSSPDMVGIGFGQNSTRQAIVGGTFGNDVLDFYTGGTLTAPKMRIDFSGRVGIGVLTLTHPLDMASGAFCSAAGAWTSVSDRNVKEDFTAISPTEVLAKVAAMPITEWKYKVEPNGTEHIGPMAQDFHAAFGLNGEDDKHIASVDEDGVALAAIQGLNTKVEQLQKTLGERDAAYAALEKQNESMQQKLDELQRLVQTALKRQ